MVRTRAGMTIENVILIVGVAILVSFMLWGGFGVADVLSQQSQEQVARQDRARVMNAFSMLVGEGGAQMELAFTNSYSEIAISGRELVLDGDFLEEPKTATLSGKQIFADSSVSGDAVCVVKQGLEFRLERPPCTSSSVACDETTDISRSSRQRIRTTDLCNYYETDDRPTFGFYCRNGIYTEQEFYRAYYEECDPHGDVFVEINRLQCPETGSSATTGCFAGVTFRCPAGSSASIQLDTPGGSASTSPACTGETRHVRVSETFTGSGDVRAEAVLPGGESDARSTTVATS